MILGGETSSIHEGKFYVTGKIHFLSGHAEFDVHALCVTSQDIQDIIGSTDKRQFADVMAQILIKEAVELLSDGVDVLDDPELSDFLGEGKCVVFLHSVFRFGPH